MQNMQFKIAQCAMHNSQLHIHSVQFTITNALFAMHNSQLHIHDVQFTITNALFAMHKALNHNCIA